VNEIGFGTKIFRFERGPKNKNGFKKSMIQNQKNI